MTKIIKIGDIVEDKFEVGMFVLCKACDKICNRLDEFATFAPAKFIYRCPKCGARYHARHDFTEVRWPEKWATMDELKLIYPNPTPTIHGA